MPKLYNYKNIRDLLVKGFSDEELRRLCFDMTDFRPVHEALAQSTGRAGIVDRLLEHADRRLKIETLLELAQKHNSDRYSYHQPYYKEVSHEFDVHVEPFRPEPRGPAQFPSQDLADRLARIRQAISQALGPVQSKQQAYFQHVDQVIQYLAHFVGLLPPDGQLCKTETFILLAAAYLHDVGRHFPEPERTLVLKNRMLTDEKSGPLQVPRLVREHYHELSWEWVENSLAGGIYPPLGLTPADTLTGVALVCLGHRDPHLNDARYGASGAGSNRVRPALLAALLSMANMLALASLQPRIQELGDALPEIKVAGWLRRYLERISVQGGHIRLHYQLPALDYSLAVRVLLSGAIQLRLRQMRDVLSANGVVVALDSAVSSGPVPEMPPDVLAHAQKLAYQRLTSTIGALGQPSESRVFYRFTGLRERPTLEWRSIAGAKRYRCQLFDMEPHLLGEWETPDPALTLPQELLIERGRCYEWIVRGYKNGKRVRELRGGIFWLIDEQTAQRLERQMPQYEALPPFERQLMQGRVLASCCLYEEARAKYETVLERGTEIARLQARQELIELYEDISRQLNRLERPSRSDQYLDAALTLAQELQASIERERLNADS